jgi:hypothetical protein
LGDMPLRYPPEFIQRIRSEFEDDTGICSAVDSGSYILGKYLAVEASKQMLPEDVITAFENSRQEKILRNAETIIRRKALHADWLRIMTEKISFLDNELKNGR